MRHRTMIGSTNVTILDGSWKGQLQEVKKWRVKRYDMEGLEHCKIEKENLQVER